MSEISIALSKGRIFDETAPLLARVGLTPKGNRESSRKLILDTNRRRRAPHRRARVRHPYLRPARRRRPRHRRRATCSLEHGGEGLYQPVDLGIAVCRMMVAVKKGFDYEGAVRKGARLRVATKYVNTTREHFAAKGVHVDLIRLYGSMELAPLVGLADAIVDLVATGHTLKANDLVRGRGDHAGFGAPHRQPGRAQDQARRAAAAHRGVRQGRRRNEAAPAFAPASARLRARARGAHALSRRRRMAASRQWCARSSPRCAPAATPRCSSIRGVSTR